MNIQSISPATQPPAYLFDSGQMRLGRRRRGPLSRRLVGTGVVALLLFLLLLLCALKLGLTTGGTRHQLPQPRSWFRSPIQRAGASFRVDDARTLILPLPLLLLLGDL